jgi:RNA 2',3'-cyclic 3'-phosphodiesterase
MLRLPPHHALIPTPNRLHKYGTLDVYQKCPSAEKGKLVRTFIAVDFPPGIITKIENIINYFKTKTPNQDFKWVSPENLHLTIKFIGEISPKKLVQVKSIITNAFQAQPAFNISIEGLGMFPNAKQPRVIWLGITDGETLTRIHQVIDQALIKVEIGQDQRKFNPHLTIARIQKSTSPDRAKKIGETLSQFKVESLGNIRIDAIHLYQSELTPTGPIYTPLFSVLLNKT